MSLKLSPTTGADPVAEPPRQSIFSLTVQAKNVRGAKPRAGLIYQAG
jgi:hypothetical protein